MSEAWSHIPGFARDDNNQPIWRRTLCIQDINFTVEATRKNGFYTLEIIPDTGSFGTERKPKTTSKVDPKKFKMALGIQGYIASCLPTGFRLIIHERDSVTYSSIKIKGTGMLLDEAQVKAAAIALEKLSQEPDKNLLASWTGRESSRDSSSGELTL